jgi:hypothetical protein
MAAIAPDLAPYPLASLIGNISQGRPPVHAHWRSPFPASCLPLLGPSPEPLLPTLEPAPLPARPDSSRAQHASTTSSSRIRYSTAITSSLPRSPDASPPSLCHGRIQAQALAPLDLYVQPREIAAQVRAIPARRGIAGRGGTACPGPRSVSPPLHVPRPRLCVCACCPLPNFPRTAKCHIGPVGAELWHYGTCHGTSSFGVLLNKLRSIYSTFVPNTNWHLLAMRHSIWYPFHGFWMAQKFDSACSCCPCQFLPFQKPVALDDP